MNSEKSVDAMVEQFRLMGLLNELSRGVLSEQAIGKAGDVVRGLLAEKSMLTIEEIVAEFDKQPELKEFAERLRAHVNPRLGSLH